MITPHLTLLPVPACLPCECTVPGYCKRMNYPMQGRLLTLCQTDEKWRCNFEKMKKPAILSREQLRAAQPPCKHRGEVIRLETGRAQTRECKSCPKKANAPEVQWKVFACGNKTRAEKDCTVPECTYCPHYAVVDDPNLPDVTDPFTGPVTRNLLYHLLPIAGNGTWQRNVEQLRRRLHVFNGQRRVAIMTGLDHRKNPLDPPDQVKAAFAGDDVTFLEIENDPETYGLRETVSWHPLWRGIELSDPNAITFYAHAKGVTRPYNPGVTIHQWTSVMYETCLDYLPLIHNHLQRYCCTGAFKKMGMCFLPSVSKWHYSGTFFWIRNYQLLCRPRMELCMVPKQPRAQWWAVEAWPGVQFEPHEAGNLFYGETWFDLYRFDVWESVLREYDAWKLEFARFRSRT